MNAMYPNRLSAMIHHSRVVRNFRNSERTTPGRPPDTGAVRVAVLTVVLLRGYRQLFRMRRRAERCAGHLLVLGTLLLSPHPLRLTRVVQFDGAGLPRRCRRLPLRESSADRALFRPGAHPNSHWQRLAARLRDQPPAPKRGDRQVWPAPSKRRRELVLRAK